MTLVHQEKGQPMPSRREIFAQAAEKLRRDFSELSVIPHNALKGGEAEELLRRFLRAHLPRRFDVTSGFVIDHKDAVSKQTDVIVYDALNCPVYRASELASIIPSDNVAAVIEVKSVLDKARLEEAFTNIEAVKTLAKFRVRDSGFLQTNSTLGCVFAFESSLTPDTVANHYREFLKKQGHLGRHVDCIAILDRGLINLVVNLPVDPGWTAMLIDDGMGGPAAEGAHIGVGVQEIGAETLDYFLRLLIAYLAVFRPVVHHPGWNWCSTPTGGVGKVTYLTSVTLARERPCPS